MFKTLRDGLAVMLLRSVRFFGRFFRYDQRILYGAQMIEWLSRASSRQSRRIEQNLKIADMNENIGDEGEFQKKLMRNFAQNILELQYVDEFSQAVSRFHAQGEGLAIYQKRIEAGEAAIIVSGHIGHWEALRAYSHMALNAPLASIYKESRNPYFENFWKDKLSHNGEIVTTGVRGTARLVKILKSGGAISLLHDQRMKGAPILQFFGQPVQTSTAAAELAIKYDVPLIPAYAIRQDNPLEYALIFEAPIPHSDPQMMMQELNNSLEAMIRQYPDQWIWNYSRFRQI